MRVSGRGGQADCLSCSPSAWRLVELGGQRLGRPLAEGLLDEPAGLAAPAPVKPWVSTFVSPLGPTVISMVLVGLVGYSSGTSHPRPARPGWSA